MSNVQHLQGIVVPVATPMNADESVDVVGMRALIEHTIAGGAAAVFVMGTTGEFPLLSDEAREKAIEVALNSVAGRVPVLVGVSAPGTSQAIAYGRRAKVMGADALVATAPYYYRLRDTVEGYRHLSALATSTDLPVFLYNIPQLTQMHLDIGTVQRLAEIPNVVGMKDSSSDLTYFARLLWRLKGSGKLHLFQGNECHLLASLALGAAGGVNTLANVAPQLLVGLYNAFRAGAEAQARVLQEKIISLFDIARLGPNSIPAIKVALHELGICSDQVARPLELPDAKERAFIRAKLTELALL